MPFRSIYFLSYDGTRVSLSVFIHSHLFLLLYKNHGNISKIHFFSLLLHRFLGIVCMHSNIICTTGDGGLRAHHPYLIGNKIFTI